MANTHSSGNSHNVFESVHSSLIDVPLTSSEHSSKIIRASSHSNRNKHNISIEKINTRVTKELPKPTATQTHTVNVPKIPVVTVTTPDEPNEPVKPPKPVKYQSDHNPVAVYLPGLFDGTKSAYIITYNEKGNPPESNKIMQFISGLPHITTVDMVFIGIQEGDVYKTFIKCIYDFFNNRASNPTEKEKSTEPLFYSDSNISIANKNLNISTPPLKDNLSYWTLSTNTYESTGKECLKQKKGACLVNGCYVFIKKNSNLTVIDTGKDIIMKYGVIKSTKHCAWTVIKQTNTNIIHVFTSCHLEYDGKYNQKTQDLLGYNKRQAQLNGYITMLYKKYGTAKRFIFCGDTNMRMLSSATHIFDHNYSSKRNYILDQMLYYLMQGDSDTNTQKLLSIRAIKKYTTINNVNASEYNIKTTPVKHVFEGNTFWDCKGCNIELCRKMLLYRLGGVNTFCSFLADIIKNTKARCDDATESILGHVMLSKFNSVTEYVKKATHDTFSGYCMNPEFDCGGYKFRAYDFSYKALNTKINTKIDTIWDVYNYKPTAIFTLNPNTNKESKYSETREFDYAKRVKSGNILAPAVVDRVFMFEPHYPYTDNTKIWFINISETK